MIKFIKNLFRREDDAYDQYENDLRYREFYDEYNEWINSPFRKKGYVSFDEDKTRWRLRLKIEEDKATRLKRKHLKYSRFR